MAGPFFLALLTYLLMLLGFYWHRVQKFHIAIMSFVILFDLCMPFYLATTRNWNKRLIIDGDILSFGVWMHFGLIITLFVLYAIQIQAGLKLLRSSTNQDSTRREHRMQAKGILLARALVIATGAMLFEPADIQ